MGGVNLSMADLDTALTNGTCPIPQHKSYVWYAPSSAINALQGGGIALVSMANSHGEDCGQPGLVMSLSEASSANYPVVGIGNNAAQAYAPYLFTTRGQRIAVLAASQLFAPGLQASWSATSSQPGVASALNQAALISAVKSARKTADTVVVYLNWGSEAKSCPNPSQPPLARALVKAGADIVVGAGTQVQAGAGYIGQALVDYGLGNLAFYDSAAPESTSGSLVVTVTGRHIDHFTWRPAVISGGIPTPLSGAASTNAVNQWASLRSCAGLSATPSTLATTSSRSKSKP
jgi:poly-gamma-glutamate synthesis protein (capsule biosynthesis protein)